MQCLELHKQLSIFQVCARLPFPVLCFTEHSTCLHLGTQNTVVQSKSYVNRSVLPVCFLISNSYYFRKADIPLRFWLLLFPHQEKKELKKLQIEKEEAKKRIQQFKKQPARMGVLWLLWVNTPQGELKKAQIQQNLSYRVKICCISQSLAK